MKKAILCSVLALGLTGWISAQPLKIGMLQELADFAPGLTTVFEQAGVPIDVIPETSARLLADLQSGAVDGGFLFSDVTLATLPAMKKIPVSLYQNEYIAVTARKDLKIRSFADLANLRVGYVRGNPTFESLMKQSPSAIGQDLTDTPQIYKMLGGDRVDVILTTTASLSIFGGLAEKPLYAQTPALLVVPSYMCLSVKLEAQIVKLTAAFDKATKNGEWAKTVKTAFEAIRVRSTPAKP